MDYINSTLDLSTVLRSALRADTIDLAAIFGYVVVAAITVQFFVLPPSINAIVFGPLVLFVPGYALVSVAYPQRYTGDRQRRLLSTTAHSTAEGLHPIERVVLSFGMSIALIPLIGGATWVVFGEITRFTVFFGLALSTLMIAAFATVRRYRLSVNDRLQLSLGSLGRRFREWLVGPSTRSKTVNLLLVASILVTSVAFVYTFAVPTTGESYTTAMLVTEQDGEYVASGYPASFTAGEPQSLTIQLANHEHAETEYTIVVAVETVEEETDNPSVILHSERKRMRLTLQPGETVYQDHDITPETVGDNLRLSYYIYKGNAPEQADAASAYRDLHVWISVTQP